MASSMPCWGMAINFANTLTADDSPMFFCCEQCIEKFRVELSRYSGEVAAQRRRRIDCPLPRSPAPFQANR